MQLDEGVVGLILDDVSASVGDDPLLFPMQDDVSVLTCALVADSSAAGEVDEDAAHPRIRSAAGQATASPNGVTPCLPACPRSLGLRRWGWHQALG